MSLFGFDVIIHTETQKLAVVDINYFPSWYCWFKAGIWLMVSIWWCSKFPWKASGLSSFSGCQEIKFFDKMNKEDTFSFLMVLLFRCMSCRIGSLSGRQTSLLQASSCSHPMLRGQSLLLTCKCQWWARPRMRWQHYDSFPTDIFIVWRSVVDRVTQWPLK